MDVEEEIRGARLSWFHCRLALVLGAVLFVDGYDLFVAAYVAPYIRSEWGLTDNQIGFMLSVGIAGLALGAFVQAPLTRMLGRRGAVALGMTVLAASSLAMGVAVHDFSSFVVVRWILGVSLGMLSPLAFVYVNEWAPGASANRFATVSFVLPFSLGGIAAGVAGMTLGPTFGWRAMYLVAAVGFPIALLAYFMLPESLVRLVDRGQTAELRRHLSALRPDRAHLHAACSSFSLPASNHDSAGLLALFSPRYWRPTVGIWLASALSLLVLHGVSGWLPTMLVSSGQAFTSAFGFGTLLMTMQILGGTCAGILADRKGRAPVMIWGFMGSAVSMIALQSAMGSGAIALAVAAAGFCIFGTQAVMNNYTAQAYEPALRGLGTGAAVAFSRVGGIIGPLLIAFTMSLDDSMWTTFALLAAAQVVAAFVIAGLHRKSRAEAVLARGVAAGGD